MMYALRKVRVSILFVVVLLAVGVIAEAQQPKNSPADRVSIADPSSY